MEKQAIDLSVAFAPPGTVGAVGIADTVLLAMETDATAGYTVRSIDDRTEENRQGDAICSPPPVSSTPFAGRVLEVY